MSVDLDALLRLLEEQPEQRLALRRVLLGDERDLAGTLAALAEAQRRTEAALTALTDRVERLAEAQQATEARVEALAQAQQRTEARLDELAKDVHALAVAQRTTEQALKTLVDVVAGMQDRLGKLDGDALERRYRERGHAYLAPIARRLRLLTLDALSPLVDDAERAGTLTAEDARNILLSDAVFTGRRRGDGDPVHLLVEASVTIGRSDLRRARERADLLARVVGGPVLPVVAGEFAPRPIRLAAQDAEVWCVTDGRVTAPTDEIDDD